MLPGFVLSDMQFAAPPTGRGDGARQMSGAGDEAASFGMLLEGEAELASQAAKAGAHPAGKSASSSQASMPDLNQGQTFSSLPDLAGGAATGEAVLADAAGGTPDNAETEDGGIAQPGTAETPVEPDASADADASGVADSSHSELAAPDMAPVPQAGSAATTGDSDADISQSGGAKAADAAAPARPDMGEPDTGKPADPQPGQPAGDQGQQKSAPAANAQPGAPASTAQTATPPGAPLPSADAQAAAQPSRTTATQPAAGQPAAPEAPPAVTRNADGSMQSAKADGDVPGANAMQRTLERGLAREGENTAGARIAADKPESGAKEAPAAQRTGAAPPAPAPSTTPQPPVPAPQTLPAMLIALQSGAQAPKAFQLDQNSESGDIRLDLGSATLSRSDSPNAHAARAGAGVAQLRMTPGHAAELGQMIARRHANGSRSFDIRLDPPELGRVQVRLEIGADRSVQAMLTADKPEALAELQRNARELEKALADAGLDLGENGIGFALSEGGEDTGDSPDQDDGAPPVTPSQTLSISDEPVPGPVSRYGFLLAGRERVDMRI